MEEELEEFRNNDDESLYENGKKYSDTYPTTFTLSKYVIDKMGYYSTELKVKKSHLVGVSIYLMYERIQKGLSDDIDELMESVEYSNWDYLNTYPPYQNWVEKVRKYTPFTPQWQSVSKNIEKSVLVGKKSENLSENFHQMICLFYLCVTECNYF